LQTLLIIEMIKANYNYRI